MMAKIGDITAIPENKSPQGRHFDHNCGCKFCIAAFPVPELPFLFSHPHVAVQQTAASVAKAASVRKGVKMTSLRTISEKLNAWRRYREAVRELSQLSDRELSDIGIRRGEIEDIVRRSVASKAAA
jgi:uncharacterized protein YjiS (DUF1127 family)